MSFGTEPNLRNFERRIRKDIELIEGILGDVAEEPLRYQLVTSKQNPTFLFTFSLSISFSSANMDVMGELFDIDIKEGAVQDCDEEGHKSHAFLLPFFCDNKRLQRLQGTEDIQLLQAELAEAERINAPRLAKTPFTIGAHPKGATWAEDIWTQRLGNGLPRYIGNNWNVTMGVDVNYEDIQMLCSGSSFLDSKQFYLFSGKPDILLCQLSSEEGSPQCAAVINVDESVNEPGNENKQPGNVATCDTVVIENKKRELTMMQMQGCVVPKKLGQVLSTLHFVLATKITSMGIQGAWKEAVAARGLLVQKSVGCYLCEVRLTLTSDVCTPEFTVVCPDDASPVSCESLCGSIAFLCKSMCISDDVMLED